MTTNDFRYRVMEHDATMGRLSIAEFRALGAAARCAEDYRDDYPSTPVWVEARQPDGTWRLIGSTTRRTPTTLESTDHA